MIKAILYVSNTGNTKRYAEMAAEMTGLPACQLNAVENYEKICADEVLYMGWVRQGRIKDYAKAATRFNIAGVCGVGMSYATEQSAMLLRKKTQISDPKIKVFYLQGGFDMNKLTGLDNRIMGAVLRAMKQKLRDLNADAGAKDEESSPIIDMLENGADNVSKEQIAPIAEWITKRNVLFERMQSENTNKTE